MSKKIITAPSVLQRIKRMRCPTKKCGQKMKYKEMYKGGHSAGFKCEKCGCWRIVGVEVLVQIREDWWNL